MFQIKTILILVILLFSACAPYHEQLKPALNAYYNGDFKEAAEFADRIHARKADRLLSYLDKAFIYHVAKEYKKSIKYFKKADNLSEKYQKNTALENIGAVLTNDNLLFYIAHRYERLLIHVFQMLNFAAIGDLEGALVEVRRINTLFPNIYDDSEKQDFMKSSLNSYLSAIMWEANGLCNDAFIDYKRIKKLKYKLENLDKDIVRTKICSGFMVNNDIIKLSRTNRKPNIVIILESGRSPVKISTEHEAELQVIPVPQYINIPSNADKAKLTIDDNSKYILSSLEPIEESLQNVLKDQMPAIIARATARLVVKEGAAAIISEEVSEELGLLISVIGFLTNRADLRSWRTLPKEVMVWKGNLSEGNHTIVLDILEYNDTKVASIKADINIISDETKFLIFRNVE